MSPHPNCKRTRLIRKSCIMSDVLRPFLDLVCSSLNPGSSTSSKNVVDAMLSIVADAVRTLVNVETAASSAESRHEKPAVSHAESHRPSLSGGRLALPSLAAWGGVPQRTSPRPAASMAFCSRYVERLRVIVRISKSKCLIMSSWTKEVIHSYGSLCMGHRGRLTGLRGVERSRGTP